MKFFKSKLFIICLCSVIGITAITAVLTALGFSGPLKLALGTVAKPFEYVGSFFANAVNGFTEVFTEYDKLKAENEALRDELAQMREQEKDAEVLKEENAWLKEYISFATEHPSFQLTGATVVAKDANNYTLTLTLNKGSIHGVKENMPVINEDGAFGHVTEVGLDWCRVVAITAPEVSVGASAKRTGETGIVTGDSTLSGDGMCHMTYIDKESDIRIGDEIYTSGGAGSAYPAGLYIGKVTSIEPADGSLTAKIEPAVDFSEGGSFTKLMIVTGYSGGSEK